MRALSPSPDKYPVKALLKKTPWQTVTRLTDGREERVGRLLLLPPGAAEVALLEGIAGLEKRLRSLSLPGVNRFRKVVEGQGGTWMLFDYEPGITLAQYIHMERRIPTAWVLWWLQLLLETLESLHREGMTVGYFEPSDILIRGDRLWLLDLGFFESLFPAVAVFPNHPFGHFIAPEKRAQPVSNPVTDLYSAGAVAFWLLTARAPVSDDPELLQDALARRRSDAPPAISFLVAEMLAPDPRSRPQSAAEALEQLRPFVTAMTGQEPPPPLLGTGHLEAAAVTTPIPVPPEPVTQSDVGPAPKAPVAAPRPTIPLGWIAVVLVGIAVGLRWHPNVEQHASSVISTPSRAPTVAQLSSSDQGQPVLEHLGPDDSAVVGGGAVSVPVHRSSLSLGPGTRIEKPHWDGGEFDFDLEAGDVDALTTAGDRLVVTIYNKVVTVQGNCAATLHVQGSVASVTCKMGAVLVSSSDTRILVPAGHSRDL